VEPYVLITDKLDGYVDFEVFDLTTGATFSGLSTTYNIILTFDAEKMEEHKVSKYFDN
jgi:hypothetical protein